LKTTSNWLERVPFLRLVGTSRLAHHRDRRRAALCAWREILFHKNTAADSGYVVQEGAIRVSNERDESPCDFNRRPGTLLAEMADDRGNRSRHDRDSDDAVDGDPNSAQPVRENARRLSRRGAPAA
jgi:CRP-like cAMP-binding protein